MIKPELDGAMAPIDFGSDLHLRLKYFIPESFWHPAKLHLGLLHWLIEKYTQPGEIICDCMAGIGGLLYAATMQRNVLAYEIEPHWLEIAHRNAAHILQAGGLFVGEMTVGQHDAREPWVCTAEHIICSPPYANEASTKPNARRGLPYRLQSGEIPLGKRWQQFVEKPTAGSVGMNTFAYGTHPDQIGHFRGKRYWQAMTDIYRNAYDALRGGYLILIVKDHIADGERVLVADETVALCQRLGFVAVARHQRFLSNLSLWQRRRKERGLPVVEEEDVLVFKKGVAV